MKLISQILLEFSITLLLSFFLVYTTKYTTKKFPHIFQKYMLLHPNFISIVRIPIALLAFLKYFHGYFFLSVILFTLAVISDAIDGIIARNCKLESKLGKSLDPLTDKIVYTIPLLYFAFMGDVSLFLIVFFIIIDMFGQFSRAILEKLKKETKANMWGKVKTTIVFVFIFYLMIVERRFPEILQGYNNFLFSICVFFSVMSVVTKFVTKKNEVTPK